MRTRRALFALVLVFCWALIAGAQDSRPGEPRAKEAAAAAERRSVYHGNARSHKFHRPGCRYYDCKNCTVRFTSRDQAVKAGYAPCKVCRP